MLKGRRPQLNKNILKSQQKKDKISALTSKQKKFYVFFI